MTRQFLFNSWTFWLCETSQTNETFFWLMPYFVSRGGKKKKIYINFCFSSCFWWSEFVKVWISLMEKQYASSGWLQLPRIMIDRSALQDGALSWTNLLNFHHKFSIWLWSRLFADQVRVDLPFPKKSFNTLCSVERCMIILKNDLSQPNLFSIDGMRKVTNVCLCIDWRGLPWSFT